MFEKVTYLAEKQTYLKHEKSAADFIPFLMHLTDDVLLLKDGSMLKTIKIRGFSFETADDEDIDIKKGARNNLLKGMASGNFALYFHTVRRREEAYPGGDYSNIFTKRLNKEWKDRHTGDRSFVNEHYITVLRKEDTSGIAKFGVMFQKIRNKADKEAEKRAQKESLSDLNEIVERVLNGFSNYGPELLSLKETNDGVCSELLKFFGIIVNCGDFQNFKLSPIDIDHYIQTNRLYFSGKVFESLSPGGSKFGALATIKEYRPSTNAGILDGFLQMPFEFIISQSFTFSNRMMAISSMQLQQRRMIQAGDVAVSQIREIDEAVDAAMSGKFAFGSHHLTIACFDDSIKSIENSISMCIVEFSNVGITASRETLNMEAAFWAQIPGNMRFVVRKSTINTLNLAAFASFHNYPSGKRAGNHWGHACTVLNTVSGTPYFFSFHVRDVGHTMIIGPTGAGKTVMMNFLCAQAQKFNCRMFFFDKDRGAEIFIRAMGGKYSILESSRVSGFNPMALADNSENRAFLNEWLRALVSYNGETITAEDVARINDAVNGNYKLPKEKRRLRNIAPFLGMAGPGSLAGRLEAWHTDGSRARLFDNEEDIIDFFSARTFGFEMAEILKDKISIGPVLLYLFHRINASLDGTPTMIILDEAWALIDNPIFAPKIKDWLKVLRKLNAFIIFATQSVEDATKSSISDTLVQQTATQIYLPNLKATEVYKTAFMLSEREFRLIKTTDPGTRFFLVKQDQNGVIAKIDLYGMGDVVRVLSGRAETVILLHEIMKEVGSEKPDDWIDIYYKRSKDM
ncbi:MAG: VirB4 family type IV secretion/conjugal transfer ATPase [Rickettsiales bacterium]|jgi:type IV secretion system protein VirB4|nr:VirB4 family type IV secretion/conjugal transfer ATPase [Rickettsiales bacterium]